MFRNQDSLVILGVDAGESSLLRLPLQSVSSAGGQDVHHINWVVVDTFQHKPGKQSSTCVYNNIQTPTFHQSCPADKEVHILSISAPALLCLPGPDLRWRWCLTCSWLPGICAAPWWSSASSEPWSVNISESQLCVSEWSLVRASTFNTHVREKRKRLKTIVEHGFYTLQKSTFLNGIEQCTINMRISISNFYWVI